jgi:hypothetical protein
LNTHDDYRGDFPPADAFDIGNGSQYQGTPPMSMDRSIFWGFFGEFWKSGQTNKWNHIYDNGLAVGQFGITGAEVRGLQSAAMMAGNAFSPALTKVGDDYYLYHNDEGQHAGAHRWRISGINTIKEQTAQMNISLDQPVLEGIDLMAGLPANSILTDGTQGWSRRSENEDYTDKYRQYWSVKTSVKSYKSVDVYIKFRQTEGVHTVSRDLGTNNNVASWKLSGRIMGEGNYANHAGGGSFLEVLDSAGRVITRFYTQGSGSSSMLIYGNNKVIAQGEKTAVQLVTDRQQPISITFNSNGAAFKFADYPSVTASIFDTTANWKSPKTMRLYFWTTKSGTNYNFDRIIDLDSMRFSVTSSSSMSTAAPTLAANDSTNTITASHALGSSEIVVSEDNGSFLPYSGQINVGNVALPAGYWKFKTKATLQRNESQVVNSPEFTVSTTPAPPVLASNDATNTLAASHSLGTSEILVSENNGAYFQYAGQINVGNVAHPVGFWKFKTRATLQRNESPVVSSPEFTVATTPASPVLAADDATNTLTASHSLGTSEILVSENSGAYLQYTGQINVGNIAHATGYWKFKTRAALQRNESPVVNSPEFTVTTTINITPAAPVLLANDSANTLTASHSLGTSEILVSENNGAYITYSGQINVANLETPAGYWKFKTRAALQRNESPVVNSPAFTVTTTPYCPGFGSQRCD